MKPLWLSSPRQKSIAAAACLAALAAVALVDSFSAAFVARGLLGLTTLAGLVFWFRQKATARGTRRSFAETPRLEVLQRIGLSQRTAMALVEIDGQPYVVLHGDGFANIRPTTRPMRGVS